ncbi:MAG: hypothetical protein WDN29_09540 [Methylovirgula sp.]
MRARAKFPILDLSLLKVPTFRASLTGGSLFRVGVGATPLLLPLMLQIGFGPQRVPIRQHDLHHVARRNGHENNGRTYPAHVRLPARSLVQFGSERHILGCYGFFTPTTPHLLMMGLLLFGGFFRSLEFTAINAITYADIDHNSMSRATSFSSVVQQLSLSVGITIVAFVLQTSEAIHHTAHVTAADFRWAFSRHRFDLGKFGAGVPRATRECRHRSRRVAAEKDSRPKRRNLRKLKRRRASRAAAKSRSRGHKAQTNPPGLPWA